MTEKTINYIKLPDGETYKIGGSGSGFNLFDTKVSDHVLEGEEALGWALQGTYVYKNGVAGSRTGYADFYNKCVEEYEESTSLSWTQPKNMSSNGSLGGTGFACTQMGTNNGDFYNCINGNATTNNFWYNLSSTGEFVFYNPIPLNITQMKWEVYNENRNPVNYTVQGSNDGSLYTDIIKNQTAPAGSSTTIDLSANKNFYKYYKLIVNLFNTNEGNCKTFTITAAQDLYAHSNGHRFYDISQKPYIDSIYESTGIADYYGIDLENERIFLPRNKYFAVKGNVSVVGNGTTVGLTDGTKNAGMIFANSSADLKPRTNAYGLPIGSSYTDSSFGPSNITMGLTTDPTKSGIEGQLTPNENKYLYYCVGNTKAESAISNVTEITTSENDTLPLFYNFYSKEDMTTTGAYVNASLGSYLSGNVYPTAYNELVNKLGADNVKANTDTYTDYDFVVNQDDMTFRLPLKNGQEIMFATGVKGNGKTLGLTDGSQDLGVFVSSNGNGIGAFKGTATVGTPASSTSGANNIGKVVGITTDSTKSGIELDTENITIPDGWNLYYKVANAVTNLELLDVAKVTADLNTKLTRGNREEIAGWGIPDYTAGISYATTGNVSFTAPVKGYFSLNLMGTGGQVTINGNDIGALKYVTGYSLFPNLIPIDKNDVLAISGNTTINGGCYFFPMKGAN